MSLFNVLGLRSWLLGLRSWLLLGAKVRYDYNQVRCGLSQKTLGLCCLIGGGGGGGRGARHSQVSFGRSQRTLGWCCLVLWGEAQHF